MVERIRLLQCKQILILALLQNMGIFFVLYSAAISEKAFPTKIFGINISSMYFYLNTISLIGFIIISYIYLSPNIERYIKWSSNKYPFGIIGRIGVFFLLMFMITSLNVHTGFNSHVKLQVISLFSFSLPLIIWLIWKLKKYRISLSFIFWAKYVKLDSKNMYDNIEEN